MTQRDSNGITQRDKTCPVAVHRDGINPVRVIPPDPTGCRKTKLENSHRDKT